MPAYVYGVWILMAKRVDEIHKYTRMITLTFAFVVYI